MSECDPVLRLSILPTLPYSTIPILQHLGKGYDGLGFKELLNGTFLRQAFGVHVWIKVTVVFHRIAVGIE